MLEEALAPIVFDTVKNDLSVAGIKLRLDPAGFVPFVGDTAGESPGPRG